MYCHGSQPVYAMANPETSFKIIVILKIHYCVDRIWVREQKNPEYVDSSLPRLLDKNKTI